MHCLKAEEERKGPVSGLIKVTSDTNYHRKR